MPAAPTQRQLEYQDWEFGVFLHFSIWHGTGPRGAVPIKLYEGQNIGHKAICRFPLVKAGGLTVEVDQAEGEARMRSLEVFGVEK